MIDQARLSQLTQNKQLPVVLFGLFVLISAWMLVDTFQFWQTMRADDRALAQTTSTTQSTEQNVQIDQLHLFGVYNAQLADLPDTKLPITLQGTISETDGKAGRAIVQLEAGKVKVFSVGQTILPGVQLKQIQPDQIIIDNQGVLERLRLPREKSILPGQGGD